MSRAAGGDRAAQQAVIDRLFGRVRAICHRLVDNRADADDAAQASLLEVLLAARGYRGRSRLETWADRITVRTARRLVRNRSGWSSRVDSGTQGEALPSPQPDRAGRERCPREPVDYLRELPEPQRTALVLRHVLEYSVEEIALETSTSPNTVKDRLLRARHAVRKQIRRDQAVGVRRRAAS
jgi:RNA polymerase sigma-70 factor (ECF subfamily)